ncbi:MAG: amidase, partial [Proteobacteria bacterium]|nr:amidase [Pseudomonadota bacterium]
WAVDALLAAGAALVGKTHTDELSRGIFGENAHYGTPLNPKAPARVPGGSSSGSAAAVAGGLVEFALGTDTGGSVRVPACFCGIFGIRPSHGRVSFAGGVAQAPSFDTVGWFARDGTTLARVGEVLLEQATEDVLPRRLLIAEDALALADAEVRDALRAPIERVARLIGTAAPHRVFPSDPEEWPRRQTTLQSREAWNTFAPWLDRRDPRLGFEVAGMFYRNLLVTDDALDLAAACRAAMRTALGALLANGTVIALPTAPMLAPPRGQTRSAMQSRRARIANFTCVAGMIGAPQINLPLATADGVPVGLSLIGAPNRDEELLALARRLDATPG